jgi:hypothetical protein
MALNGLGFASFDAAYHILQQVEQPKAMYFMVCWNWRAAAQAVFKVSTAQLYNVITCNNCDAVKAILQMSHKPNIDMEVLHFYFAQQKQPPSLNMLRLLLEHADNVSIAGSEPKVLDLCLRNPSAEPELLEALLSDKRFIVLSYQFLGLFTQIHELDMMNTSGCFDKFKILLAKTPLSPEEFHQFSTYGFRCLRSARRCRILIDLMKQDKRFQGAMQTLIEEWNAIQIKRLNERFAPY